MCAQNDDNSLQHQHCIGCKYVFLFLTSTFAYINIGSNSSNTTHLDLLFEMTCYKIAWYSCKNCLRNIYCNGWWNVCSRKNSGNSGRMLNGPGREKKIVWFYCLHTHLCVNTMRGKKYQVSERDRFSKPNQICVAMPCTRYKYIKLHKRRIQWVAHNRKKTTLLPTVLNCMHTKETATQFYMS